MLRWRQVSWTFQHFNFPVILRLPGARIPDDRLLATDRRRSAVSSQNSAVNPGSCRRIGSSGCPPRRNGNTPAGPGRRPQLRSAISSAANRRISRGSRTTGPSLGRRCKRAAKVGSYPANAWGLHDMHGNIYEWCRDWYHVKLPGGTDPDLYSAKTSATKSEHGDVSRARRGGCWSDDGWPCRSAFRLRFEPERRYDHIGFRVVAVQP